MVTAYQVAVGISIKFSQKEINKIVDGSKLDNKTKNLIKKIFYKIAIAEAKIHNEPINKIHFHEIGAIDTIIDIAGAVMGINKLGIEKIYCSKLNVGSGFAKLVALVNNIDFIFAGINGRKPQSFPQFYDVIHISVRSGVYLDQIHRSPFFHFFAKMTNRTSIPTWKLSFQVGNVQLGN